MPCVRCDWRGAPTWCRHRWAAAWGGWLVGGRKPSVRAGAGQEMQEDGGSAHVWLPQCPLMGTFRSSHCFPSCPLPTLCGSFSISSHSGLRNPLLSHLAPPSPSCHLCPGNWAPPCSEAIAAGWRGRGSLAPEDGGVEKGKWDGLDATWLFLIFFQPWGMKL